MTSFSIMLRIPQNPIKMTNCKPSAHSSLPSDLPTQIRQWALELGFQQTGFSPIQLNEDEARLLEWLDKGHHGEMDFMQRHGTLRSRPDELHEGTQSVICVRMDYFPPDSREAWDVIEDTDSAFLSRYALGRDYHKVMRNRLQKLAQRMESVIGPFGYRAFVDSAPVLEKPLARQAGLGWVGKHSNILNRNAGSWFFLGELFTDLPLPPDEPVTDHCGKCTDCIDVCPTQAIVAPYEVDARRCISYLTIELRGSIPEEFRVAIGNRIYGCDDCQLICPWNRFSQTSELADFAVRHSLDDITLDELAHWQEHEFLSRFQGSPIRRIGFECWQRNLSVALGNAPDNKANRKALFHLASSESALVREHAQWAISHLDRLSIA